MRKKGIFLSVELVTVMVILITLVSAVIMGASHGMRMYKVYLISKEYSDYSKLVLDFYNLYNVYPGDVDPAESSGVMVNSVIKSNAQYVFGSTVPNSYPNLFLSPGTRHIDGNKALLSFQQLQEFGSDVRAVSKTYVISSACNILNFLNTLIPPSRFSSNAYWLFGMDSSNITAAYNNSPTDSVIYNANLYNNWRDKLRMSLFNGSSITSCNLTVSQQDTGVISPQLMAMLDDKIDDGSPSLATSILIGENYTGAGGLGCTKSTNLSTDPLTYVYLNSSNSSGKMGCIATFMIAG